MVLCLCLAAMPSSASHQDAVIAATRHWLARAVIGLNLCPFAKSVYVKEQVRYVVSQATEAADVLDDLERELKLLAETEPAQVDTTLLIVPDALADFLEFNDVLFFAERLLKSLRLEGMLQIASFHPQYQFEGTEPDDIENYTNRAPYPILHLLREDSIARAAEAFPDAADIYERNMETMRRLGHEGWQRLMDGNDGDDSAPSPRPTDA
ncbi:peptidase [Cupriavidus sp. UYMMa02A]|nr:peptidase [Cupriavidus sp. UYMMa02A]